MQQYESGTQFPLTEKTSVRGNYAPRSQAVPRQAGKGFGGVGTKHPLLPLKSYQSRAPSEGITVDSPKKLRFSIENGKTKPGIDIL